jgi:hypothetical protein
MLNTVDPGMYDPKPLLICPYKTSDSTVAQIANEIFSLTKIGTLASGAGRLITTICRLTY